MAAPARLTTTAQPCPEHGLRMVDLDPANRPLWRCFDQTHEGTVVVLSSDGPFVEVPLVPEPTVVWATDAVRLVETAFSDGEPFALEALDPSGTWATVALLTPMRLLQMGNEFIAAAVNHITVAG